MRPPFPPLAKALLLGYIATVHALDAQKSKAHQHVCLRVEVDLHCNPVPTGQSLSVPSAFGPHRESMCS